MGRLALPRLLRAGGRALPILLLLAIAVGSAVGCAGSRRDGFYYTVRNGDNLYRIGLRYGVPHREIARANHVHDVHAIAVGTRLWIPGRGAVSTPPARPAAGPRLDSVRKRIHREARVDRLRFLWPVRGRITSGFGRRGGRPHEGIDISARRGTAIHAAEAGKVIHSGRLGAYGKVVIVKHEGSYRTVYAHARRLDVRKGQFVERGQKIAEVGTTGNATGPHVHFELRDRETPRDPMLYLP
jgi:LysM repeat protein